MFLQLHRDLYKFSGKSIGGTYKSSDNVIEEAEIMQRCPDISQVTIQRTLNDLVNSNRITKIGGGRYTKYIWNREKEKM